MYIHSPTTPTKLPNYLLGQQLLKCINMDNKCTMFLLGTCSFHSQIICCMHILKALKYFSSLIIFVKDLFAQKLCNKCKKFVKWNVHMIWNYLWILYIWENSQLPDSKSVLSLLQCWGTSLPAYSSHPCMGVPLRALPNYSNITYLAPVLSIGKSRLHAARVAKKLVFMVASACTLCGTSSSDTCSIEF
jgi:hypothetical protein